MHLFMYLQAPVIHRINCRHCLLVPRWFKGSSTVLIHCPTMNQKALPLHISLSPSSFVNYCYCSSPQIPQHKWMLRNTLQRQPLPRILLQQLWNQILGILRQSMRPSNIHPLNPPIRCTMTLRLKRRYTHKELIQQYPQCPRIYLLIVFTTLHHFRRQVIQRTAKSITSACGCVDTPSKVGNFDIILCTQ